MFQEFLSTVSKANIHQVASVVIGVVWVLLIPLGIAAVRFYQSRQRGTTVSTDNNSTNSVHHNVVFVVVRRDGPREEGVYDPFSTELVAKN